MEALKEGCLQLRDQFILTGNDFYILIFIFALLLFNQLHLCTYVIHFNFIFKETHLFNAMQFCISSSRSRETSARFSSFWETILSIIFFD